MAADGSPVASMVDRGFTAAQNRHQPVTFPSPCSHQSVSSLGIRAFHPTTYKEILRTQ
jgi:hypothetical protein